jgi:arylsulfatase A-like enzyme
VKRRLISIASALSATLVVWAARADHAVFDLVANRPLAHQSRSGGLTILAGTAAFARYLHFSRPLATWKLRLVEDGKKVALAGTQSVLEVPLTAAQARTPTVTLHLKSPVKQTVRASVSGKASAAMPLNPGWQTVTATLPQGALADGENKIVLTFAQSGTIAGLKASAAVEWIQIGGTVVDEAPPAVGDAQGLNVPGAGSLAWYVQIPQDGAALVATGDAHGCTLKVRAGKSEQPLTLGQPVSLRDLSGRVTRLEISADGCPLARLTAAALTASGAAPTVNYTKRPKNVLLWLTDSTRADKYRVYNPKTRVETPVMDAWAKDATVFKVGYVQGNESRVSHASLFTGLYPAQHHFISEKAKLDPKFVTLPEALKQVGLETAGFMGNGFIDKFWGFGDGWDLLKNHIHDGGGLKAEDLRRAAEGFLGKAARSFFLYVGTIDAHVSWRAHEPWIKKYDSEPYAGPFVKACLDPQLDKIVAGQMHINDRDKVRIAALYDSDVSYNDREFGELTKKLNLDETLVILIADHGDEFWEHGKIGHGQSLHDELVHIPFVIHYPPLFPPGKLVDEGVELIDVLPTLVDALGGTPPPDAQGESLVPLAQGVGAGYPRPAIASQYELAHAMRLGRWKLWVGGSGDVKLFDAIADAGETRELQTEKPVERRFVADALGLWMAYQGKWKKTRWGVASNLKPQFAADLD